MEVLVMPVAARKHPEVELAADRVPLPLEARRERQLYTPRDEQHAWLHTPATLRSVASSSPNTRSGAYAATEAAAAAPNRSRSASSVKYRRTALASACVSPAGTSSPLTPS